MPTLAQLNELPLSRLQTIASENGLIGPNVYSRIDPESRKDLIEALDDYYNASLLEEFTVNHDMDELLIRAVKDQDYGLVRALLEAGANPLTSIDYDEDGFVLSIKDTPLFISIISLDELNNQEKKTSIKIFDILLKVAVEDFDLLNYTSIVDTLLNKAVQVNNVPAADHLLYYGADPNVGLKTAIDRAYEDMELLLLEYGADPDLL